MSGRGAEGAAPSAGVCARRERAGCSAARPPSEPPPPPPTPIPQPAPTPNSPSRSDDEESADFPAQVAGPNWSVPLTGGELSDLLIVLQQLRGAVAQLHAQGQWLPAAGDRPISRAKVRAGALRLKAWASCLDEGFLRNWRLQRFEWLHLEEMPTPLSPIAVAVAVHRHAGLLGGRRLGGRPARAPPCPPHPPTPRPTTRGAPAEPGAAGFRPTPQALSLPP